MNSSLSWKTNYIAARHVSYACGRHAQCCANLNSTETNLRGLKQGENIRSMECWTDGYETNGPLQRVVWAPCVTKVLLFLVLLLDC